MQKKNYLRGSEGLRTSMRPYAEKAVAKYLSQIAQEGRRPPNYTIEQLVENAIDQMVLLYYSS